MTLDRLFQLVNTASHMLAWEEPDEIVERLASEHNFHRDIARFIVYLASP